MFCQKCGSQNPDNAVQCASCGQPMQNAVPVQIPVQTQPVKHDVPRCTCCGYVGEWKLDSVFRPVDFVIGIILLILGIFPGIIYFATVGLIRSNKDRRAKICPSCKAKNLWTFFY